jgi:ubiquinone/menaquinone biosynthesis C-methylase UbiE
MSIKARRSRRATISGPAVQLRSGDLDVRDIRLEQAERREWSRAAGDEWQDALRLYEFLTRNTNLVEAAGFAPWGDLLPRGAVVLDAGCGSGWLAAQLSSRHEVARVIAVDASARLLHDVLPQTVELMGGNPAKIEVVCGDFTPLPAVDRSIDLLVASSTFHHAEDPATLLRECRRVLAGEGALAILNKVPSPPIALLRHVATMAAAASINAITPRLTLRKRGHVAADHLLYDEELGDRAMTMAQWRRLLSVLPSSLEVIDTGLPIYRPTFRPRNRGERNLTHFICRPGA